MPWPLVVAGLGGLALSSGANLYAQHLNRQLYRRQINAYSQMQKGYASYLAKHGRKINPVRGYINYYGGKMDSAGTNYRSSLASSFGTAGGTFGAGTIMATRKWL